MGSVPGCLWPVIVTQGPFLVVHAAKMDSSEDSGRLVGQVDWCHLSSFDLS